MNRKLHIVVLISLGLTVVGNMLLEAQNYVGFSLSGFFPVTLDRSDMTHAELAYGAGAGFVYEWHKNSFFLQTGIQYQYDCPSVGIDSLALAQEMIDTRGVPFIYRGMLKKRTDCLYSGQITLPMYVGGEWNNVYVMAGVKAVLYIHSRTVQTARLQTIGDYGDRYYEWIENAPTHGYHDFLSVRTEGKADLSRYDVRVGAEAGYTFSLRGRNYTAPARLRLGAFAEYGLVPMTTGGGTAPLTQTDYSQYMQVAMTHVYASSVGSGFKPHIFLCGLRLTFLFPIVQRHCMCSY